MKIYLIALLIITVIFIFITLYIIFTSEKKRNEKITICGVLWAMISAFTTLLISILNYQSDDINIVFKESPEYYGVADGRYNIGGYRSLLYDVPDIILPETCVPLQTIDFTKSYIDKDLNSDRMTIFIYTENNKSIKKEYTINLKEKDN